MPLQRIPRTLAHAGLEARQIIERCRHMAPHDQVTYAELTALVGVDVQERRDLLDTARKGLRQEYGMVFGGGTGVGLVCLDSPGMVGWSEGRLQRLHRASGRVQQVLDCVQPEGLTPIEKHRWLAQCSITASVALFTHPKTITQLAQGQPPPALPFNVEAHQDLFRVPPPPAAPRPGTAGR